MNKQLNKTTQEVFEDFHQAVMKFCEVFIDEIGIKRAVIKATDVLKRIITK